MTGDRPLPDSGSATPSGVERAPRDTDLTTAPSLSDEAEEAGEDSLPSEFLRAVAHAPARAPSSQVDLTGTTLGRYQVNERLGRGAMGIVYSAQDLVLRRSVALKVLPEHLVRDADRRHRFLREARSAALAAHPHIAAVYDVQEIEGQVVIAMERVEGQTLRNLLSSAKRQRTASPGFAASYVAKVGRQIASGLSRAHEVGIVHRDLKPDNLMIGPGDQVKILDFGVAKLRAGAALDSEPAMLTGEGQIVGTPSYMAPEQARGLAVDARADIFALGVVLYELATGIRPFAGASIADMIAAFERGPPLPAVKRNPAIGAPLSRLIERCLRLDPEERYASCNEVAAALQEIEGRPQPSASARRRWAFLGLAGLVPILLLALLRPNGEVAPPSPAAPARQLSPLVQPGAVLACPPLAAEGVPAPSGWLGAAAASMACRRARALFGGAAARVVVPAALLDLPKQPHDDFPQDPFADAAARGKALEAARARAAAHLDGQVVRERERFRVNLALKDASNGEIGGAEGQGATLHEAVRAAMAPLIESGALPRAPAMDPEVAKWSMIRDVDLLLPLTDWELALDGGERGEQEQARIEPRKGDIPIEWMRLRSSFASMYGEGWETITAPAIDRSSAAAFAKSAPLHALLQPGTDVAALAEEAHKLAAAEPSGLGNAALALAEAQLRDRAGDSARARALTLAAVAADPSPATWEALSGMSYGQPGQGAFARGYAAWVPESPNGWNEINIADEFKDLEGPLGMIRRAHTLAPGMPLFAVHESMILIRLDRREQARAIAAELLSPRARPAPPAPPAPPATSSAAQPGAAEGARQVADPRLVSGEYVLAEVEASEGRLGAAMARARRALFAEARFGSSASSHLYLLTLLLDLSMLLGGASEVAEELVKTYVDPEPSRLYPGRFVPSRVASACAFAPKQAAQRCFARLRSLLAAGYFREELLASTLPFIDGAEAYARGDFVAAAAAWAPISRRPGTWGRHLLPDAFDRAHRTDLAESIDGRGLSRGPFNGVGLAHVRTARRALAAGDMKRAGSLARRIVDALSSADVPVPAVAEMRALLARIPPGQH